MAGIDFVYSRNTLFLDEESGYLKTKITTEEILHLNFKEYSW